MSQKISNASMSRQRKGMGIFLLVLILCFFWNASIVNCWVGEIRIAPLSKTATLCATTRSTEPSTTNTAHVALEFPSSKERFRNLTRAIEYSVVHDEEEMTENSVSQEHHNLPAASQKLLVNGDLGDETAADKRKCFPANEDVLNSASSTIPRQDILTATTMRSRRILGFLSIWLHWVAGQTRARLGKLLLLLLQRNHPGFSPTEIGGIKRHYALLLASLSVGGRGCLAFDPGTYHRAIVESAHHQTVASFSPSTLSKRKIHVSTLEGHALKWALRQRRRQHNQHDGQKWM